MWKGKRMKRKLLLMLLCAALGLGAAQAEVYRVENETDVPADWAEKDTLRLTCIDTNRSDAMVLQSGGEAMMVDSGEGRYRRRVYATLNRQRRGGSDILDAIAGACMRRWMDMASRN